MKPFTRLLPFAALLAFAITFSSCDPLDLIDVIDDDDTEQQNNGTKPNKDAVTVGPNGALVTHGDISVNFPKGTFSEDHTVSISALTAGEVAGEHEVSKFYQVIMPATTKKKLTIRIKCDEQADDIYFVERSLGFALSYNANTVDIISHEGTYADGEYKMTIDPVDNGTGNETVTFAVGLAHVQRWDGEPSRSAATRVESGQITWHLDLNYCPQQDWDLFIVTIPVPDVKNFGLLWLTGEKFKKFVEQKTLINGYIREAIDSIHALGYKVRTDRNIPYVFTAGMDRDTYGAFCQSWWSDEKSCIQLNLDKIIAGLDPVELRQTVIHETMHYFQADYDRRPPKVKAEKCYDQLLMYESGAVWAEKCMDDGNLPFKFIKKYIMKASQGMVDIDGVQSGDGEATDFRAYQNHGYGMPMLLEYMVRKMGLTSTLELYEIWRDTGRNTIENLKAWAAKHNLNIFEGSNYDNFIFSLLKGEITNEIAPTDITDGKLTFTKTGTSSEIVKSCCPYGARIFRVSLQMSKDSIMNKRLVIFQRNEKVQTYAFFFNGQKREAWNKKATVGDSLVIDGATLESYRGNNADTPIYVWVVSTNILNQTTHQSAVTVRLEYDTQNASITPSELHFPAEGGTKNLKITASGFKKFGYTISSEYSSWLSGKAVQGGNIEVTAKPNTSNEARTGYVRCYVTNEQNPTEAQKTYLPPVKVTQDANTTGGGTDIKVTSIYGETYSVLFSTTLKTQSSSGPMDNQWVFIEKGNASFTQNGSTLHVSCSQDSKTLSFDIINLTGDCSTSKVKNLKYTNTTTGTNSILGGTYTTKEIIQLDNLSTDIHLQHRNSAYSSSCQLEWTGTVATGLKVVSFSSVTTTSIGGSTSYSYVSDPNNEASLTMQFFFDYTPSVASSAPRHRNPLPAMPWSTQGENNF